MARRKKQSHSWVYVIWGINGVAILCLLGAGLFYFNKQGASAANISAGTSTAENLQKIPPTSYFLPTLTPNPFYTPPPFETSTPFVLTNGQIPGVIGFSVAGRPIE